MTQDVRYATLIDTLKKAKRETGFASQLADAARLPTKHEYEAVEELIRGILTDAVNVWNKVGT